MFEPDEGNRKIVEKNTILNDSGDFDVIEKAVWSSTGQINFRSESSENSRVDENARAEVETITLDDFQEKEPTPDIIKIDVEGKELEVLKGGEATLKEHQPDIFIEIHYGIEDAVKVSMVDDFMRKHGYSRQFSSDCPPTLQAKYSIDTSS
jgi:FkbM family methyltransferase